MLDGLKGTDFLVDVTFAPELTDSCRALAFRPPPCQDTERHTHAPVRQGLSREPQITFVSWLQVLTSIVKEVDRLLQGNLGPGGEQLVKLSHLNSVFVVDAVNDSRKDGWMLRPAVPSCVPQQLALLFGDAVQWVPPADHLQLLGKLVQGLASRSWDLYDCVRSGVGRELHRATSVETHFH